MDAGLDVQKSVRDGLLKKLESGEKPDAKAVGKAIDDAYLAYEKAHPDYHRPGKSNEGPGKNKEGSLSYLEIPAGTVNSLDHKAMPLSSEHERLAEVVLAANNRETEPVVQGDRPERFA